MEQATTDTMTAGAPSSSARGSLQDPARRSTALVARAAQRGVTLVEVLIVVAIMAMLAGGVAFALLPKFGKAQEDTAKQGALEIRKVVQAYQLDKGNECPTPGQLKKEGYLDRAGTSNDPWGSPYAIKCEENEIYVSSAGKDKKRGTQDDIQVPAAGQDDEE
jgi:general secretion pathway protein G